MSTSEHREPPAYRRIKIALNNTSDADIARRLKVNKSAVSQWKKGKTEPSAYNLIRVSQISNMPLEWLLTGDEKYLQEPQGQPLRALDASSSENSLAAEYSIEDLLIGLIGEISKLPDSQRHLKALQIIHEITQNAAEMRTEVPLLKGIKPKERARNSDRGERREQDAIQK